MKINRSAVSLTVEDVAASAAFFSEHLGFREEMSADGFVSLGHPDAGLNVVLLRRGLEVLPEGFRDQHAAGLILAFTVDDAAGAEARLREAGAPITMPLRDEPWGERLFQTTDPNGVVVQFVEWLTPAEATAGATVEAAAETTAEAIAGA
ncbi:VOC family protein [Kitasatospora sp. YST-16]|uniref:VOC family protein n=1 Tax=Kitasatospora sp. YST-16 TaxID=2998080 RepID=UPI002284BA0F|nr:VOC family protein [Kitasatospora sp. YST-16]WAL73091.1 VOC family protein [Kitasatospora sp. YST-16]WNW39144.1 VOC family protein [Streptomyces sp. Li-HN-5-13]